MRNNIQQQQQQQGMNQVQIQKLIIGVAFLDGNM